MEKIRALIIDDEPLAREGIRMLLECDPDVTILGECADGRDAVRAITEQRPDIIFLDVQMPEIGGFEVLEAVGVDRMPVTIFVTAYDKYALRAFDVHALDYLLKPFTKERFRKGMERAKAQLQGKSKDDFSERVVSLLEDLKGANKYLERLVVKTAGRIFFLNAEEVDWIEAAENYVRLHVGRESHLVHGTMNRLESRLDPRRFLRIHRSVIVNISRIKELYPQFHGEYVLVLQDGTRLNSGRSYRDRVQELLTSSF